MMMQFGQLCNYFKDPIHVAWFQQICGVRGTFSRNPVEIRGVERGHLHNVNGISHLQGESEKCIVNGEQVCVPPFGTELGNETFYITFFPFFIWNVDAYVSCKDIIGWSRPVSDSHRPWSRWRCSIIIIITWVVRALNADWLTAVVYFLFYLFYLYLTSRIYMSMHSTLDIIAGFLYSLLILVVFQPALDLINNFKLTYHYAPLIIISLHLGMGLFSFTLDTWSTSWGDTAQILGTGTGVALASHLNHYLGLMSDSPLEQLPLSPPALRTALLAVAMLRFYLGTLVLLATRALMKAITIPLARQHMEVELPYKHIVYGMVGFNTLFLVPQLLITFRQLS
uniref:Phosphatidic acid phosphatase type 2/haloperoxidase domain-containing protein n=1 Tax=Hucho hucho TaxID=62062 RepID=A0A4W5PT11_9TELE